MIGVRVPILRKIAKEINLDDFLKNIREYTMKKHLSMVY